MAAYFTPGPKHNKMDLIASHGRMLSNFPTWEECLQRDKEGYFTLCVVVTNFGLAAGIVCSRFDYSTFSNIQDRRAKHWHIMPKEHVALHSPDLKTYYKGALE